MSTSQDPGSLGVYGLRNRSDHSYDKLTFATSASIKTLAIWDHLAREGKKSIIVGVPPNYPPRRVNGISIGCFLTPDTVKNEFTYPPALKAKINELVGEYPVDVKNFRTDKKDWLKEEIFNMSGKQWAVVRWLLTEQEWDYFHFVDIGLDRMHHGFWNYSTPGMYSLSRTIPIRTRFRSTTVCSMNRLAVFSNCSTTTPSYWWFQTTGRSAWMAGSRSMNG